jgi:hypothetical protein
MRFVFEFLSVKWDSEIRAAHPENDKIPGVNNWNRISIIATFATSAHC